LYQKNDGPNNHSLFNYLRDQLTRPAACFHRIAHLYSSGNITQQEGLHMKYFASVSALVLAALLAVPGAAKAAPIVGSLDYVGTHTVDGTNFLDSTQSTINFATVIIATGDFATLINVGDPLVHASPLPYAPPAPPIAPLWTHASGFYFDLEDYVVDNLEALQLNLSGTGTFACLAASACDLAGFEPTAGIWNMTLNLTTGQITGSFSSSSSTVAEPGLVALLGLGLLGVGRACRRRHATPASTQS
jgi:MYXO-CTERM domain-containing protein